MSDRIFVKLKSFGKFARTLMWSATLSVLSLLAGMAGVACFASQTARGQAEPARSIDPVALLRAVRETQSSIKQTLQGKLRKGAVSVSYRMVMNGPTVRFEFPNAKAPAPEVVTLRFGEKAPSLEVSSASGASSKVNFSDEIMNMGVCYEDLALRFLYWGDATLEGEESLMLAKCWKIRVRRPPGVASPYKEVLVWVSQNDAAFLKSESYGEDGTLLRKLTVRQIQSLDQVTTLKQLRIESPENGKTPTYLDVDGQPTPRPPK